MTSFSSLCVWSQQHNTQTAAAAAAANDGDDDDGQTIHRGAEKNKQAEKSRRRGLRLFYAQNLAVHVAATGFGHKKQHCTVRRQLNFLARLSAVDITRCKLTPSHTECGPIV